RAPPETWKTSPGRITIQRGSATEPASASASPDRLTYVSGSGWLWSGTTTPGGIVPRMVHGAPSPSSGRVRNSMIGPITSTPATVRGSTRYAVVMTISPLARMLDARRPGGNRARRTAAHASRQGPPDPHSQRSCPPRYTPPLAWHHSDAASWPGLQRVQVDPV